MTQQHQIPQMSPPSPQPKRSRPWLWVVLALWIALSAAVTITAALNLPNTRQSTTQLTTHTVLYEAEGAGARGLRTASYTLQAPDGSEQGRTNLPMKNTAGGTGLTVAGFRSGDFVYLSVQNEDAAGSVTCRITVDGKVLSENTSDGGYTIATCKGQVP